jgi:hypothetical protein
MSIIPETPAERRKRMLDEQEGATYLGHTDPDLDTGGRYARQENAKAQVIAQSGPPHYPAAAEWTQTELPPEPPLSLDSPALGSLSHSAQAPGPASPAAPQQRGDAGPSFPDDDGEPDAAA